MLTLKTQNSSIDGSTKVLWELQDGQTIESVILPRALKQRKKLPLWSALETPEHGKPAQLLEQLPAPLPARLTACLSSQVGCAMACDFCLTGKQGLLRNLTAEEIIAQVTGLNRVLATEMLSESEKPDAPTITNLVFMGMGEPLQNLQNVIQAIQFFMSPQGLKLSRRKILVSTSGVLNVNGMNAFDALAETGVRLALSLNATTDELRSQIMPINKKFPIAQLMEAAKKYGTRVRQTVMLEYILLDGLNNSAADAERLIQLTQGWNCKVNLIPYNAFGDSPYRRPTPESVKQFQHQLVSKGVTATVRYSGGDDILAACGQLKSLDAVMKRGFSPPVV